MVKAAGLTDRNAAGDDAVEVDPIKRRADDLVAYQSAAYARKYLAVLDDIRAAGASPEIIDAVARNLYKLMAYKDEYEVARLLLAPEARQHLVLLFLDELQRVGLAIAGGRGRKARRRRAGFDLADEFFAALLFERRDFRRPDHGTLLEHQ